jgi:hypothetical protein
MDEFARQLQAGSVVRVATPCLDPRFSFVGQGSFDSIPLPDLAAAWRSTLAW